MNYLDVRHKINDILEDSTISIKTIIDTRYEQEKLLNTIFGDNWNKEVVLSHMTLEQADGLGFLSYCSKKKYESENIVIIKDDKPLFKVESIDYYGYDDSAYFYENINTTYIDGTSKIENRIMEKKWHTVLNSDTDISEVTLLSFKNNEYSRHKYTFYKINDEIVSFKNHDQMWLKSEVSFNHRLDVMKNNVSRVENRIDERLNYIFTGENVKKYEIRRKNS